MILSSLISVPNLWLFRLITLYFYFSLSYFSLSLAYFCNWLISYCLLVFTPTFLQWTCSGSSPESSSFSSLDCYYIFGGEACSSTGVDLLALLFEIAGSSTEEFPEFCSEDGFSITCLYFSFFFASIASRRNFYNIFWFSK